MADPLIVTPGQIVAPGDWNALLLQHGDLQSSVPVSQFDPKVQAMITANPELAATLQQHPIYRYYMADGSYVEAQGQENGEDVQIISYQPSQKFQQAQAAATRQTATGTTGSNPRVPAGSIPQIEGTPVPGQAGTFDNSQPIRAWHAPDGSVVYEPLTPAEVQQWQRDKNGGKTDAEQTTAQAASQGAVNEAEIPNRPGWKSITTALPATTTGPATTKVQFRGPDGQVVDTLPPASATDAEPLQGYPGWTTKKSVSGTDTKVVFLNPQGQEAPDPRPAANAPKDTPTLVTRNGVQYVQHSITRADGTPGDIYYTKPGSTEHVTPPDLAPDTPTAAGPKMPNFVLGGSQAALTQYKSDLQQGVATKQWTQKWADDRWAEAIQLAQQVNQDYATQQREVESTRNAQMDLAKSRATLGQNAITMALDHVDKINGLLPENSPLGGQTFAALLGINMLMEARSGIDTINPSARPSVPTLTPADMANPQAVAATRAAVASQVSQASASASAPLLPPPPPVPGQTPIAPAAVPGTPPPLGDTGAPAAAPVFVKPDGSFDIPGSFSGGPDQAPPPTPAGQRQSLASPSDPVTIRSSTGGTLTTTRDMVGEGPGQYSADPARGGYQIVTDAPPAAAPTPIPPNVSVPAPSGPQSMAPSLPPILAQYQPQTMTQTPNPAAPSPGLSPAMLATKAATTPPWRLTPDEITQMQAAGVPEATIWSVPGAPGVAA